MKRLMDYLERTLNDGVTSLMDGLDSLSDNHDLTASFAKKSTVFRRHYEGPSYGVGNNVSINNMFEHSVVCGKSGSGKSSSVCVPSIINCALGASKPSMLIVDLEGSKYHQTKGLLTSQGYDLRKIDLERPEESDYFNPLSNVYDSTSAHRLSSIIVRSGAAKDRLEFWDHKAQDLITHNILHLIESAPRVNVHLAGVARLIDQLAAIKDQVAEEYAHGSNDRWLKARSILNNSEATLSGIISSAQAFLSFISNDKTLARLSSVSTLQFQNMREKPTAIFLTAGSGDVDHYASYFRIFFDQFFSHFFKTVPLNSERPILVIADEAGNIKIPDLDRAYTLSRKHLIGIQAHFQGEEQIFSVYGQERGSVILGNAFLRMYFPGGAHDECKRLTEELGSYTYTDSNGNKKERRLLTQDEVRILKPEHTLVIPTTGHPIYLPVTPWFKSSRYQRYVNMELPPVNDEPRPYYNVQYWELRQLQNTSNHEDPTTTTPHTC